MIWHILIGQNNRDTTPSLNIEYWSQNFVEIAVVVPCISFWTKKCPLVAFRCRLCRPRIHLTTIRVDFIYFRAEIYNIKHPAREESVVFSRFWRERTRGLRGRFGAKWRARVDATSSYKLQRSPKLHGHRWRGCCSGYVIGMSGQVLRSGLYIDHERLQRAQHRSPMNSSSRKLRPPTSIPTNSS